MSARLILGPDAPRETWLAVRLAGITASEIAAVLCISPFESPFSLYWRKRGELGDVPDSDAMSLGRHLEPWIADRFAVAHPSLKLTLAGLHASEAHPWQMATPDRLVFDAPADMPWASGYPCTVWEGKTSATYDGWGEEGTDDIPAYYRAQVQWQLDVMGLPYAYLSTLFLHTRQVRHYRVDYDASDCEFMRGMAQAFMGRVQGGDVPPIDGHKATTAALKWLHPKIEDREVQVPADVRDAYTKACEWERQAKVHKTKVTNRLRVALGDAKTALFGAEKVASRSVYDRKGVDIERLRADFPDAYTACLKITQVDKVNPARRPK